MSPQPALVFDADAPLRPKPRRTQHAVWLLPETWTEIDERRGKLSRSAWIERAIAREIAREDGQP